MSRFAPVCPAHILTELYAASSGDYHLLLAHDVAENPAYKAWFDQFRNFTIIMDNSVIELGNAVDLSVIKKACQAVPPTTIVLPDVLLDASETVASCKSALVQWGSSFRDILGDTHTSGRGFMIVPQGQSIHEWAWCAEQFANDPDINFWGIPRNLVKQIGTRKEAIEIAHALNPHRQIHLLGFSDDIVDDVICARSQYVAGIDSAVPLRAASEDKTMSMLLEIGPRGNWWVDGKYVPMMDHNIQLYKQWIRRTY